MKVTLYTKRDCSLCERAEDLLRRARRATDFDLDCIFVDNDNELFSQYGDRVPVILVDGTEAASAPIDEAALLSALLNAA